MSTAPDVAYLDAPYVEHVERRALRVSLACWDDACFACDRPGCACACHDDASLEAVAWRAARDAEARQQAAEARARLLECVAEYYGRTA